MAWASIASTPQRCVHQRAPHCSAVATTPSWAMARSVNLPTTGTVIQDEFLKVVLFRPTCCAITAIQPVHGESGTTHPPTKLRLQVPLRTGQRGWDSNISTASWQERPLNTSRIWCATPQWSCHRKRQRRVITSVKTSPMTPSTGFKPTKP